MNNHTAVAEVVAKAPPDAESQALIGADGTKTGAD